MKKSKLKYFLLPSIIACLTGVVPTSITFAATWNGVSGVSDSVVNSITQYENEAASYQGQIDTLSWSISQNEGTIALYQGYLALAQAATASGDKNNLWYGREAECLEAIANNDTPMRQRIAERSNLQALQNQARSNANAARGQANAEAAAILAEQNEPKPPVNDGGGNTSNSGTGNNGGENVTEQPGDTDTSTTPTEPSNPGSDNEEQPGNTPGKDNDDKEKESEKEKDKDKEKEPVKPPKTDEDAQEIVDENKEEIKDELNDFDHGRTVDELVKKNDDNTYTVTEDALKRAILDSINQYRFQAGLKPVEVSDGLVDYAVAKAEDAKEQMPQGHSGHGNSQKANNALDSAYDAFDKLFDVSFIVEDLASFQSDFQDRNLSSKEAAEKYARNMAESIVGEYGGFMSDDHSYDILNPYALFANIALTSSVHKYTDVWTGEEKNVTIWYLAYAYVAGQPIEK